MKKSLIIIYPAPSRRVLNPAPKIDARINHAGRCWIYIAILLVIPSEIVLALGTDYRFTGKPFDADTDLYYYGQRYYDPNVGRFTQSDPALNILSDPERLKNTTGKELDQLLGNPQRLNPYSYTLNNPINYVDPTGESEIKAWLQNPYFTLSQVGFWKRVVSNYLKPQGMAISAYFLQRSLGLRMGNNLDLNIKQGNDQYNVIGAIQKSKEYNAFIQKRIDQANADGLTGFYFEGGLGTKNTHEYVIFESDSDLKYSLHQSNVYITGTKMKDGQWSLSVQFKDSYDYKEFITSMNKYKDDFKATFGNNIAYLSEDQGAISNYNINIEFNQTWGD